MDNLLWFRKIHNMQNTNWKYQIALPKELEEETNSLSLVILEKRVYTQFSMYENHHISTDILSK